MAQRASICRMLITEPAVLLLDEPFSALDELSRDFMNMELQRICAEREATAFLVTHSIPEAVILSDVRLRHEAAPGPLAEVVAIDLPRPRTLDMITTPKFGEIVDHIRGLLDKGGVPVTPDRRRHPRRTTSRDRLDRAGLVHRPRAALGVDDRSSSRFSSACGSS